MRKVSHISVATSAGHMFVIAFIRKIKKTAVPVNQKTQQTADLLVSHW